MSKQARRYNPGGGVPPKGLNALAGVPKDESIVDSATQREIEREWNRPGELPNGAAFQSSPLNVSPKGAKAQDAASKPKMELRNGKLVPVSPSAKQEAPAPFNTHANIDVIQEQDRLSHRLEMLEEWFSAQPWKCDVRIEIDSDNTLAFTRKENVWRLVWTNRKLVSDFSTRFAVLAGLKDAEYKSTDTNLEDCSAVRKAKAAELLPKLMSAMKAEYENRLAAVKRGHDAIDQFERSLRNSVVHKEGA